MTEGTLDIEGSIKQELAPKSPLREIRPENKKLNLLDCDKWSRELETIKLDSGNDYSDNSVMKAKNLISRLFENKSILDESFKDGDFKDIEISIGILDKVLNRVFLATKDNQMLEDARNIILFGRDTVLNNIENLDKFMESADVPLQSKKFTLGTVNLLYRGGINTIVDRDERIPIDFKMKHFEKIAGDMIKQGGDLSIDNSFITDCMFSLLYSTSKEESVFVRPFIEKLFADPNPELRNIYYSNFFEALRKGPRWNYFKDPVKGIVKNFLSGQVGEANSEKIIENWQNAWVIKGGYEGGEALGRNLSSLYNLECKRPGIGKILFEQFGISDFGRYPQELLIAQYDEINKKDDVPYGIIINPVTDPNGAFYNNVKTFQNLHNQIKNRYRIKVWEVKNLGELIHAINDSRHRYGPISFAIIGGHGTEESIKFGERFVNHNRNAELLKKDLQRKGTDSVRLAFVENPTIILNSCTTGSLGGIGQEISKMGAKVIAPPEPIATSDIEPSIDSNGKIDFRVTYIGDFASPQIYKGGVLQNN